MSLLAARTALLASRRIASSRSGVNASLQTKRRMGSGAAAPEWEGIDKVVRGYFPQDDQREFFIHVFCRVGRIALCGNTFVTDNYE